MVLSQINDGATIITHENTQDSRKGSGEAAASGLEMVGRQMSEPQNRRQNI